MDKYEQLRDQIYHDVTLYVRDSFGDEIEKAYDYFWEEESPDEFLQGIALEMAFINFEDWLICDYGPKAKTPPMIDRYIEETENIDSDKRVFLDAMKDSYISLYEVKGSEEGLLRLEDLMTGETREVKGAGLPLLGEGDILGSRLISYDGRLIMGRCIYPFGKARKNDALDHINKQLARYRKNKKEDATAEEFLREESWVINMAWVVCLAVI